jgi:hypothetical protein
VATACLLGVVGQRRDRLADRFEKHFHQIYDGTEVESLPLIDEVLRNLALTRQFVLAAGSSPAPAAAQAAPATSTLTKAVSAPVSPNASVRPAASVQPAEVTLPSMAPQGRYIQPDIPIPAGTVFICGWNTMGMQFDGNLVIYDGWGRHPLWATGTAGHPGSRAVFQSDGNLVVYDAQNRPLWASNTVGSGFTLGYQGDGNLVVYNALIKPLWASGTDWQVAHQ